MCEVLVRATDTPVPDSPGKWLSGMGVVAMPDGHVWGAKEGPPRFVILKLPKITVQEAQDRLMVIDSEEEIDPETGLPRMTLHRRRVDAVLQTVIDQALANGGTIEFPTLRINRIDNYLRRVERLPS